MRRTCLLMLLVSIAVITAFAGCTETPPPGPVTTTVPSPTLTTPTVTGGGSLLPSPTVTMPSGKELSFQVDRDQIQPTITITFRGGRGQIQVRSIDVTVVRSDGQVSTKPLEPKVGSTVIFIGTKGKDRAYIDVTLITSERFHVLDTVVDYYQHA
ncbi:MAG: hypothetical protein LUO93_11260 [Methanomicrobiales archaeon]|nr:hypothetical protein [Methanomicrobiales archaeon]